MLNLLDMMGYQNDTNYYYMKAMCHMQEIMPLCSYYSYIDISRCLNKAPFDSGKDCTDGPHQKNTVFVYQECRSLTGRRDIFLWWDRALITVV